MMNGRKITEAKWVESWVHKGRYLAILAAAASSRADGEPSKGMVTSTRMAEELSGEMTTRSGRLSPVVSGRGCCVGKGVNSAMV